MPKPTDPHAGDDDKKGGGNNGGGNAGGGGGNQGNQGGSDKPKKRKKPTKEKTQKYLKDNGHKSADVDGMAFDDEAQTAESLRQLHKVDIQTYRNAGGKA